MKSNYRKCSKLSVENLEKRELFAGDVTVGWDANDLRDLVVLGDDAANRVIVEEVSPGQVRVTGQFWGGSPTLINGSTQPLEISVSDDVNISMEGGNDWVQVKNLDLTNQSTHGDLKVNLGSGSDDLLVYNSDARDLRVDMESGHDEAAVSYSAFDRDLLMNGHAGEDEMTVISSSAGRDLKLKGHEHDDTMEVRNSTAVRYLNLDGDTGDDEMTVYASAADDIFAWGDQGEDKVNFDHATAGDQLWAYLGSDDDELRVVNSSGANVNFHGGSGFDTLIYPNAHGNNFNPWAEQTSFEVRRLS